MLQDTIRHLRRDLTDKYVLVVGERPELVRFRGFVGQVKTVNFSGRALVEFTGFFNNPAWFDLDPADLKIVDKPPEPVAPAAKAARPASKVPGKAAAGPSAADILATARSGARPAPAKADAAGRTPTAAPAKLAAPREKSADKKLSPSVGQSTADILAAARAAKAAASPPPADESAAPKRTSPAASLATADVLAAARGLKKSAPAQASDAPPPKKPTPSPPSGMTTEEILAAARAAKKPAAEAAKPSAIDALAAGSKKAEGPRRLTAEDIRDIGSGKVTLHRTAQPATEPVAKKTKVEAEKPAIAALPKKIDRTKLTAADILAMGLGKRSGGD